MNVSGVGGSLTRLRAPALADLQVLVPPLDVQDRLLQMLAVQSSRLDAAVASLTRVKSGVTSARASVLKAAVDGRLVPTEAKLAMSERRQYEPAQDLLLRLRGDRERTTVPESAGEVLPTLPLPPGWAWTTMGELAEVVGGITKDSKRATGRLVPYLRVANVQRGRLDLTEVKLILAPEAKINALRLVPGDVLLNEGGDRDKLGRGWVWRGELPECIHQNHVFRARVRIAGLDSRFLSHGANLQAERYFLREGKQSTNLASISMSKVKALPIALPPLAEVTRILAEVDRRLSVLDQLECLADASLARCVRLRQAILKRAFESRLLPPARPEVLGAQRVNGATKVAR